jgi:prepilin-type N-terminal cleavage/methylation domain-containing protein
MKAQRGFTLIELLIALGVMAVFALMAYRGLDSVMRLHQGAYDHEKQAQAIDRVITQLEADVRQASSVQAIAPAQDGAAPGLKLKRRVDTEAGSELAEIIWRFEGDQMVRQTTLQGGVQIAPLLTQISAPAWLTYAAPSGTGAVVWRAMELAEITAQPAKAIDIQKGLGLRVTVAGKAIEKLFLLGR